ncbi:MAG: ABC transporter permease [Acidobacteriaceae bacterium]|nr:ABC transporter permease [Acidobacteriaceae bacterium]MBV9780433.1 ABC transporter permease [Acidobacteriaceae bacterium]
MRWFRRRERDKDLERELRSHLELEAEELQQDGASAEEARYAARRSFGNPTLIKEDTRSIWTGISIERLWQDTRFALRTTRNHRGSTAIAALTLALGIGANTAIFSVVNTVLLAPLPYKDADRLMTVWGYNRSRGFNTDQVSAPDFADWRLQNHVFEDLAASTDVMYTLTGSGEPMAIIGYRFSANFFHVLGVAPLHGRTFFPAEQQPGKDHVVVLGYQLWQSRFGGDRSMVGRTVRLDGAPYTVIGVMPRGVDYPGTVQLWTPLTIPPEAIHDRAYRFLRMLGRLKPGVSINQAQTEMNAIARHLAREYPKTNKEEDAINIISLRQMISGDIRPALLVLMCAVGFVLLIACANVANLLLVRAVDRRREVAIRAALGAAGPRLIRQFLTESILLALAAGALGLLLAFQGTRALVALFPPTIANLSIPRIDQIPIDSHVLGFSLLASLLAGTIFGLIPAFEAMRSDTGESLKESSRTSTGTISGRRFRSVLVTLEIALSLILLAAAGVTLKSFAQLLRGNLGFNPQNVLTARLMLPPLKYESEAQQLAFGNQVADRVSSLPGVQSAGTVTFLPLSGWWGTRNVSIAAGSDANQQRDAVWSSVTPDYFRAMGIPLIEGRSFTKYDDAAAVPVAILSITFARRLVSNENPLGKRLKVAGLKSNVEVIGVVGDVHQLGMTSDVTSEIYFPFSQVPTPLLCFAIRTAGYPMNLANAVERQIWAIDKDQAVSFVMPMADLASESLAPQRVISILLGIFAVMALIMAAVGIYGVISFATAQRTQEIGVRIALGAHSGDVLKLIAGQGLPSVAVGLALGLAGSVGLMRFLSSLLYGVRPADPLILAIAAAALVTSALLASYVPAHRAAKLDPTVALRHEYDLPVIIHFRMFCSKLTLSFLLIFGIANAAPAEERKTITGWVLDSACAFTKGLDKPISRDCALACARKGSPLVILQDDGTVFWPISESMPAAGQNDRLLPYAGKRVTATGKVYSKGGSQAVVIEKLTAANQ